MSGFIASISGSLSLDHPHRCLGLSTVLAYPRDAPTTIKLSHPVLSPSSDAPDPTFLQLSRLVKVSSFQPWPWKPLSSSLSQSGPYDALDSCFLPPRQSILRPALSLVLSSNPLDPGIPPASFSAFFLQGPWITVSFDSRDPALPDFLFWFLATFQSLGTLSTSHCFFFLSSALLTPGL